MNQPLSVTKLDGSRETFDESKLAASLKKAGASAESIDGITDEIEREMWDGMTTADIYSHAFMLLRRRHHPTAIKYSLRRALFDLGPDGFPFERFVARIFQLWGYDAITDQTLMGSCVTHEVDVVAWKGEELSMVEAKFHNELGLRSDVKVTLYVKARFDDLAGTTFNFGGQSRKLSQNGRWLITNTKFTDQAIKYGECNGLRLLGWNYPSVNNLHQIVEQNGLHPITCLNSLNHQDKKNIIGQGILTCIDIIGHPDILTKVGIKPDVAEKVLTEAQLVVQQAK